MTCPTHPELGYDCTMDGRHLDHAALVDGEWVFWQSPAPERPSTMTRRGKSLGEILDIARNLESDPLKLARSDDPSTSRAAAVKLKTGSQKYMLLEQFIEHPDGLTDEEAATYTGLIERRGCCWWHRCSDLRQDGLIIDTGRTRPGASGDERMVCVATQEGVDLLCQLRSE